MSCWEILGIAQTFDLTAIKTAYAAKAKEWHPEEHPEEFKQLQQAYRNAVRMAKLYQEKTNKAVIPVHTAAENWDEAVRQGQTAEKETAEKEAMLKTAITKEALPKAAAEKEVLSQTATTKEALSKAATEKEVLSQTAIKKEAQSETFTETGEAKQKKLTAKASVNKEDIGGWTQNPGYEEAEKSPQNFDYEEIRAQSQGFDYEEVEEADLKDQFFQEFFSIAWNPYLMNNLVCWEYMLKRSPYEQLLSDPKFRRNFVLTTCHQLMGW